MIKVEGFKKVVFESIRPIFIIGDKKLEVKRIRVGFQKQYVGDLFEYPNDTKHEIMNIEKGDYFLIPEARFILRFPELMNDKKTAGPLDKVKSEISKIITGQ